MFHDAMRWEPLQGGCRVGMGVVGDGAAGSEGGGVRGGAVVGVSCVAWWCVEFEVGLAGGGGGVSVVSESGCSWLVSGGGWSSMSGTLGYWYRVWRMNCRMWPASWVVVVECVVVAQEKVSGWGW